MTNQLLTKPHSQGVAVQGPDGENQTFSDNNILENGLYPIAESKKVSSILLSYNTWNN